MPYEYGVVKIKLRRDTAANLSSVVLASGEPAFATDTNVLKIGNGSAAFSALSQIGSTGGGGGGGSSTFLGLSDSPSAFTSSANKLLAVNSSANAITFIDNSGATSLQSGDNISLLNNDSGFTSNAGDITAVTAGTGLTGGGSTGSITINIDNTVVQSGDSITVLDNNNTYVPAATHAGFNQYDIAYWNNASATTLASSLGTRFVIYQGKMGVGKSNPAYQLDVASTGNFDGPVLAESFVKESGTSSQFLKADGSVDSTAYGDITSVTAGSGLSGGGSSGAVTINVDATVVQSGDNVSLLNNDAGYLTSATTELSDDTSPVLGGNLDVGGNDIISSSNGNIDFNPNGTGQVVFKGNPAGNGAGQFVLNCEFNSHGITIKGPPHSAGASYTLTLPDDVGTADQNLTTDGSGNLSWTTPSGGGGGGIASDTGTAGGGSAIANMVTIGAAAYSGLTPNAGTLYFITGA